MAEQKNPAATIDEEPCEEDLFEEIPSPKKTTWPELVGLTADEAEKKIKEEMPTAHTFVLPQGSSFTFDYRIQRVRIFVDSTGKVVETPHIG